ncbi:hypothetical protein TcasGA2_TC004067 [Tribolium castaneum]|uniref:Putative ionotropic receptor ligand binding domain-containing protein n=1 Tax=Tribolium castaneum TaxID=7070 RepID=D7EIF1_TRICA|nr:hypothetical protein TcasGA2_TC004067 [Tribolium castaneum]
MPLTIIFLLFVINPSFLHIPSLPLKEKLISQSLTQCVYNAVERFFEKGETIFYFLPLSESVTLLDQVLLPQLTHEFLWSLVVKNVTLDESKIAQKPTFYIIHMQNQRSTLTKPRQVASDVITKLWKYHIVNGVVLLPDHLNPTVFNAFSWFPYHGGNCGTNNQIELIDSCSNGSSTKVVNWYPQKIPKKFNQCTIKVRMIQWPPYVINIPNGSWSGTQTSTRGFEISILDLVAEFANVRMFYHDDQVLLNWGDIYDNGTITGNLKYLSQEIDDIAVGAFGKTLKRSLYFDDVLYHHHEGLVFCVPFKTINSKLHNLGEIMDFGALVLTLVLYLVVTTMSWLVNHHDYTHFYTCAIDMYRVLLGMPIYQQPRSTRVRFFVAMLIIYSFYVLTAYQTLLTSALASVSTRQEISTIDEIIDRNLDIHGIKQSSRYFASNGTTSTISRTNAAIFKKYKNCANMYKCFDLVAFNRNVAVCAPKYFTQFIKNSYKTSNNDPLIYCFKEPIVSFPIGIVMRKGLHFYYRFKALIGRIVSSGFTRKWKKEIRRTRFENFTSVDIEVEKSGDELDFNSLKLIFCVWLVGCVISLIVFICEVVKRVLFKKN